MTEKKGLGKGLGALFGEIVQPVSEQPTRIIPLQKAEPDPTQPRKHFDPAEMENLAQSIRDNGVIQPLTVREMGDGFYRIIAGERRWRAARMAGLDSIPVLVVDVDDQKAAEPSLIENLQRQDLDPIEEAMGYKRLIDEYGMTQAAVADSVMKARTTVTNTLRLLELPPAIQELLAQDEHFTPGHARAVLQLKSEKAQLAAAQKIAALQLSVRQAELMCRALAKPPKTAAKKPLGVDYIAECESQLRRRLNRGVKIVTGKRKGHLTLDFYGNDDLQTLLDALQTLQPAQKKQTKGES